MKKLFVVFAAVLAVAGISQAQGISTSAHDFSTGYAWNTTGEICIVCHTPHNTTGGVPLWNRAASSATYSPYGTTLLGTASGTPTGSSLVCLSCHDGTVGLGNFGGTTGDTTYVQSIRAGLEVGIVLTNDHPISVNYIEANGLHDPATTAMNTNLNIEDVLEGTTPQVQCGSCHNVHNESGSDMLLHTPNTASALCLKCHIK